jgi:O-glycosyl hydrolase
VTVRKSSNKKAGLAAVALLFLLMTSCHFSFDGSGTDSSATGSSDSSGTDADTSGSGTDSATAYTDDVTVSGTTTATAVSYSDTCQTIDGFGGSNAWISLPTDSTAADKIVKLLYSKTDGIGLTILRNRIPFREYHYDSGSGSTYDDGFINRNADKSYVATTNANGTKNYALNWSCWELSKTKTLISRITALGSKGPESLVVMSTPWTPPNNSATKWKIDYSGGAAIDYANTPDVGGTLDPNHYADYADLLADYSNNFKANMGISLAAVSVQNEPTWCPSYESCYWTAANIRDFLKVMKTRFGLKSVSSSLGIIAPEDENFEEDMITPSLADSDAASFLTHVGVHQYDHATEANLAAKKLATVASSGKKLWVTEVSSGDANDSSITDGIYWARMIHYDMTVANTNAFLYWWLWSTGSTKSSLVNVNGSTVTYNKRLYALGQYSRFVRPGWVRIAATMSPRSSVYMSAYRSSTTKEIAIVLINDTESGWDVPIAVSGITGFATIGAWRTSSSKSLAAVYAPVISATSNSLSVKLPSYSVTTLYGTVN